MTSGRSGSIRFTVDINRDGDETITTVTSSTSPGTIHVVGAGDDSDLNLLLEAAQTIEDLIRARTSGSP